MPFPGLEPSQQMGMVPAGSPHPGSAVFMTSHGLPAGTPHPLGQAHLAATSSRQDKGKGPRPFEPEKLFVQGLPQGISEDQVREVFNQYCSVGTVVFTKVLPPAPGKEGTAALVRCSSADDAKWIIDNLHSNTPSGLTAPVLVKNAGDFSDRKGGDKGKRESSGKGVTHQSAIDNQFPGSRNFYVEGIPGNADEDSMWEFFSQYVNPLHIRVLPMAPNRQTAAGFLRVSQEDGDWVSENMAGQLLSGLENALVITDANAEKGQGKFMHKPGPRTNRFIAPLDHLASKEMRHTGQETIKGGAERRALEDGFDDGSGAKYARHVGPPPGKGWSA